MWTFHELHTITRQFLYHIPKNIPKCNTRKHFISLCIVTYFLCVDQVLRLGWLSMEDARLIIATLMLINAGIGIFVAFDGHFKTCWLVWVATAAQFSTVQSMLFARAMPRILLKCRSTLVWYYKCILALRH